MFEVQSESRRIDLPTHRSGRAWTWVFTGGTLLSIWAAGSHLVHFETTSLLLVALSVGWLLLVGASVVGLVREAGGVVPWLEELVGHLVGRRFLAVEADGRGVSRLCVGYRLAGLRVHHLVSTLDGSRKIEWSRGQASAITGEDMEDWSLTLQIDEGAFHKPSSCQSDRGVFRYWLGVSGSREEATALADEIASSCRAHGVRLERETDTSYARSPADTQSATHRGSDRLDETLGSSR
jgi:hypothetical protein